MKLQSTVSRIWPAIPATASTPAAPEVVIMAGDSDIPDDDAHARHREVAQRLADQGLARIIDPNAPADGPAAAPQEPPGADHPPLADTHAAPAAGPALATDRHAGRDIPQPGNVTKPGGNAPQTVDSPPVVPPARHTSFDDDDTRKHHKR